MISRRAVALCRPSSSGPDVQRLVDLHDLWIVYTVVTDCSSTKLVTMIAAQYLVEHAAEALVVPHMARARIEADERWYALTMAADIVTGDGVVGYAPLS